MFNIYLIGMMGSGKTVTVKRLAAMLECPFTDLDELIQERTRRSIVEIFQEEGEFFFRDQESALLKEVSGLTPRVVATGGGTVLRADNVSWMKRDGKIVFLETSLDILWSRVKDKKDRPLLKGKTPRERLLEIYHYRTPIYRAASDLTVNTDGQSVQAVASLIYERLKS